MHTTISIDPMRSATRWDQKMVAHRALASQYLRELVPETLSQAWMDRTFGSIKYSWDLIALQNSIITAHHGLVTMAASDNDSLYGSYFFAELCTKSDVEMVKPLGTMVDLVHLSNGLLGNIALGSHSWLVPESFRSPIKLGVLLNQMWFTRMIGYYLMHGKIPGISTLQKNQIYRILMEERFAAGLGRAHVLSWLDGSVRPVHETEYDQAVLDMGMPAPLRLAVRLFQVVKSDPGKDKGLERFSEDIMVLWKLHDEYESLHEVRLKDCGEGQPAEAFYARFLSASIKQEIDEESGAATTLATTSRSCRLVLEDAYMNAIIKRRSAVSAGMAVYGQLLPVSLREKLAGPEA